MPKMLDNDSLYSNYTYIYSKLPIMIASFT
nr:MAG TPA: hypothetical protein [Bacteriophage sp.]